MIWQILRSRTEYRSCSQTYSNNIQLHTIINAPHPVSNQAKFGGENSIYKYGEDCGAVA